MCLQDLQPCIYPEGYVPENRTPARVQTFCTQASPDKCKDTHTSQKPLTVSSAGSATPRRAPDEGHMVNHHGEGTARRVRFCQICGKAFKGLNQLCGHVRQPQGVEEVQVTECGSKFVQ